MQTYFASPERDPKQVVAEIAERLRAEILLPWFDALPMSVLVTNRHRQIIFCNEAFTKLAFKQHRDDMVGLRPGEALDCVHARLEEAGCGCSKFCSVCGAAKALVKSLRGMADCENCRMLRRVDGDEVPLDLQIFTQPIEFHGEAFTLLSAMDISHEMRLRYLERTFFHDMINSAGGVSQLASLLEDAPDDKMMRSVLADSSERVLQTVLYHRDVSAAELDKLAADPKEVEAAPLLRRVVKEACRAHGRPPESVVLDVDCRTINTDPRILGHVLRNMLDNGLEAGPGEVSLTCRKTPDGKTLISVENDGEMPRDIARQLFKRYVSTKDADRGLGTYVIKLLTERHLGGSVSFVSREGRTTFDLLLP